MHGFVTAAVMAAFVGPTALILGLLAYVELTRSQLSPKARD